jgi:hypothetical protein
MGTRVVMNWSLNKDAPCPVELIDQFDANTAARRNELKLLNNATSNQAEVAIDISCREAE